MQFTAFFSSQTAQCMLGCMDPVRSLCRLYGTQWHGPVVHFCPWQPALSFHPMVGRGHCFYRCVAYNRGPLSSARVRILSSSLTTKSPNNCPLQTGKGKNHRTLLFSKIRQIVRQDLNSGSVTEVSLTACLFHGLSSLASSA